MKKINKPWMKTIGGQDCIIIPVPTRDWREPRWQQCWRFLQDLLIEEPIPAAQVQKAAKLAGFSPSIVRHVKKRFGIRSLYGGKPYKPGIWWWQLPEPEGTYTPQVTHRLLEKSKGSGN